MPSPRRGCACRRVCTCQTVLLAFQRRSMHVSTWLSLGVASPVGLVLPIHPNIAQHEGVDGVAGIEDGKRRTQLRMKHRIRHCVMAAEHVAVLYEHSQPDLAEHTGASASQFQKALAIGFWVAG